MRLIAFCYLLSQGDERNKCLLFERELQVIKDGRIHQFPLGNDINFIFSHRKWMLPLITGSITFCLGVLFIFRGLFNPWISLSLAILAIYLIYLGWEGTEMLLIRSSGLTLSVPIRTTSLNLKEFVRFVESYQNNWQDDLKIYHITSQKHWREQEDKAVYTHNSLEKEGFIHCSHERQLTGALRKYFSQETNKVLLTIDPLQVGQEIRYEAADGSDQLFPHIYGAIDKRAIVASLAFTKEEEIEHLLKKKSVGQRP